MKRWAWIALAVVGVWAAGQVAVPRDGEDPGTPATWSARAEEAFRRGDADVQAAADETDRARAVHAWSEAARYYLRAFRLVEPVPDRREERALLAFRAGRSLAKAARTMGPGKRRGYNGEQALFWLAHAQRLAPALRAADYERAALFDSDIEAVRDPHAALGAWQRFLASIPAEGPATEREREQVEHARARLEALQDGPLPRDG